MPVRIEQSSRIPGVYLVYLSPSEDARGLFFETYRRSWIPGGREMVQANRSESRAGVLRGLHYHRKQADYWCVFSGRIRAGLYDFRAGSPGFGSSETIDIAAEQRLGLYIPPGVAHGFLALTDVVLTYLVDEYYDASDEQGLHWNDPALKVNWGTAEPLLSERDRKNPLASEVTPELRP
jgi:dTDP-4-dehydrorhamnose 3,5-epimerase